MDKTREETADKKNKERAEKKNVPSVIEATRNDTFDGKKTTSMAPLEVETGQRQKVRFRIGLKISFVLVTLFVSLASAAAIHLPWYYTATNNIKDLVSQLNAEIISGISNEVSDVFSSTQNVQQSIKEALRDGVVDVTSNEQVLNLFLPFIKTQEHFSWISLGRPNGDFLGVNRTDDDKFRSVESIWSPTLKQAERSWKYYVVQDNNNYLIQRKFEQQNYDARERPWYKRAMTTESAGSLPIWTDVYVFATNSRPGLNTALRLEKGSETAGVVSIAIELERLSSYLKEKFKNKPGTAVIIRPDQSMLAFVDASEVTMTSKEDKKLQLRKLGASYHPLLSVAAQALKENNLDLATLYETAQVDVKGVNGTYFVTFSPIGREGWIATTIIPEAAFLDSIKRNNQILIVAITISVLLVIILAIYVSRKLIVQPVSQLIKQTKAIERFDLEHVDEVGSHIAELDDLSTAFKQMSNGLAAFQKYLPADLVQILVKNNQLAQVGGINRTMTIFFSDLEGFTTISETLGPGLVPYLSDYLKDMSAQIDAENGTIDKFIGDAIMAFWGAPNVNDNQATDACRAALRCNRLLQKQAEQAEKDGKPVFRARIGLNTGRVIVGNIGSDKRMDYTVLGDPVNLAARLEALNKAYDTRILIGATTFEFSKYEMIIRKVDSVNVKGKDQKTPIYELLSERPGPGMAVPGFEWIATYEKGLDMMERHFYREAIELFNDTIKARGGDDGPSKVMIERCINAMSEKEKQPDRLT